MQGSGDPQPGVYPGIPYETYASWNAVRASILTKFKRSAAHARVAMLEPATPTPEMDLGTALHCAILEPGAFDARFVRGIKVDRRTNAGKAAWAEFENEHATKSVLSADDHETCERARASVWRQPWAEELLSGPGQNEMSAVWKDQDFAALCKLRLDRFTTPAVIDLKSARDASADGFRRAIANLDYHVQAAFYLDGLDALAPHPRRWIWIAVEKEAPWCAALYEPSNEMLDEGRRRYRAALSQYVECQRSGFWPGYPHFPQSIDLPPWAKSRTASEEEF